LAEFTHCDKAFVLEFIIKKLDWVL
jgi:hypothetical protein